MALKRDNPVAKKASKGKKLTGKKELSRAKTLMGIRTLRVDL
jgi:hypothetical protein